MRVQTLIAVAALVVSPTMLLAQANDGAGQTMTMVEILQQLESDGYTAFDDVDRERDHYEVTATDPNGQFVEIEVDGRTGDVIRSHRDD